MTQKEENILSILLDTCRQCFAEFNYEEMQLIIDCVVESYMKNEEMLETIRLEYPDFHSAENVFQHFLKRKKNLLVKLVELYKTRVKDAVGEGFLFDQIYRLSDECKSILKTTD